MDRLTVRIAIVDDEAPDGACDLVAVSGHARIQIGAPLGDRTITGA